MARFSHCTDIAVLIMNTKIKQFFSFLTNDDTNPAVCIIDVFMSSFGPPPSHITVIAGTPSWKLLFSIASFRSSFPASINTVSNASCHHFDISSSILQKLVCFMLFMFIVPIVSFNDEASPPKKVMNITKKHRLTSLQLDKRLFSVVWPRAQKDIQIDMSTQLRLGLSPIYKLPHEKTNKMTVHPVKTQISLGIRPVWSESSLCAQ